MATTAEEPITQDTATEGSPQVDVPVTEEPRTSKGAAPRASRVRLQEASPRRTRVVVRRVGSLSVLKFSLLFYFCAMLVMWLALLIIFLLLQAGGVTDAIAKWASELRGTKVGTKGYEPIVINGAAIFGWLFVAGCVVTVVMAVLNLFVALMYNLISDIVGGVEVTLAEKRRS
jgi:Transmembrane domain of unknown function (DUF3566).